MVGRGFEGQTSIGTQLIGVDSGTMYSVHLFSDLHFFLDNIIQLSICYC